MNHCPHCNRPLESQSDLQPTLCPHCGATLGDQEGLAGRHTIDLLPADSGEIVLDDLDFDDDSDDESTSSGSNVLDDLDLPEDDAEETLPFNRTVEFRPPRERPPSDQTVDLGGTVGDSTIDFDEKLDLGEELDLGEKSDSGDESPGGDQTIDEIVLDDLPDDADDPSRTIDYVSDATVEFDAPQSAAAPSRVDQTVDFDSDKTIDLAKSNPELAAKVTNQWGGTVDQYTPQHQTIRQQDDDTRPKQRSTLPVKSRTMSQSSPTSGVTYIHPSDAPDYELLNQIGEGGMGVVYAARQSSIARTVAIKMLKAGTTDGADQRDKFISEAVVTGELDHPNIVPIYDLGSNDRGALFYSMKHVQGTPWEDVLTERSLDENLNILLRVADALAFAHARGVVHRDLKPENVMLGEFGEVLVMDWGLARVTQHFPNAKSIHQTASLGGTPAYMAPEMARGPAENIDHTSDIYLLGAMLYELIGGKPPHSGRDVMQCLMAAAQNVIDPIDYRGELLDIALKAMSTERSDRYQSVKDFQAAVRVYLSHSESLVLTSHAEHHLADARQDSDYKLFARALYGFGESLALWPENSKARQLQTETEVDYATLALANGDLDLAESLLETDNEAHATILQQVHAAQRERRSKQSLLVWTKRAVAALLVGMVVLGAYSYYEIAKGRKEALAQRDLAKQQEEIAVVESQRAAVSEADAQASRKEAEANEALARENEKIAKEQSAQRLAAQQEAERQKDLAEVSEREAKRNAIEAERQAKLAQDARDAEEYEAYVAGIGLAAAKIEENAFDFALTLLDAAPPERRDWEWGRLRYLCELTEDVHNLGSPIDAVALSPDGKLMATGDRSGRVTVMNAATGEEQFSAKHGQYVYAVTFSPDSRMLATASSDGKIRLITLPGGELRETLVGHEDGVLDVAFSPDGKQLVSASYDDTARVWDTNTGKVVAKLAGHSWWVWSARFAPDGDEIVTASQDSSAIVWRRSKEETYKPIAQFTDHKGPVYCAVFSPDGASVASGGYDMTIRVWRPRSVGAIDIASRIDASSDSTSGAAVLTGHTGPVRSLAFGPDSSLLLSGSHDNSLRLWDLENDREIKTLRGHGSRVESVDLTTDGLMAASGGQDGTLRVWDVAGYAESRTLGSRALAGHADAVLAARFTADGHVLTASRDRTAKIWSGQGEEVAEFAEGHEYLASSAVFFDEGRRMITGAGDNTAREWNVASGAQVGVFRGTGRIGVVAIDPANRYLVTGGPDNQVTLWDIASHQQVAMLAGHDAEVTAAAFHPDGSRFATGDDRGTIRVWRLAGQSAELITTLTDHNRAITALEFTPEGEALYSSSGDNTCARWDLSNYQEAADRSLRHPDWVGAMDLSQDGQHAVTACLDGKVRIWDLAASRVLAEAALDSGTASGVALSLDGGKAVVTSSEARHVWTWDWTDNPQVGLQSMEPLVSSDQPGTLWTATFTPDADHVLVVGGNDARLYDATTGEPSLRYSPHGAVAAIASANDGKLIATGSWDGTAKLWDTASGRVVRQLVGGHTGYINSIDFSADGQLAATASDDGTVRLWRTGSGQALPTPLAGHRGNVNSVRFSPDGTKLITTGDDRTAKLWDVASGKLLRTLEGHRWAVLCGVFSDDSTLVATGSRDNTARVWDVNTGDLRTTMSGHTAAVTGVALTPSGTRLLTGSQDTTAKLWDAATGNEILTLDGHEQDLTAVDFSADGRSALTASRDGTAVVWPTVDWRANGDGAE